MGQAALQRAREHFDRRRVVERTLAIYREEFDRRDARRPAAGVTPRSST
jgi:hypothetical protein